MMPLARLLVAGIRKQSDVVSSRVTIDMTIQASVSLATFGFLAARAVNIVVTGYTKGTAAISRSSDPIERVMWPFPVTSSSRTI